MAGVCSSGTEIQAGDSDWEAPVCQLDEVTKRVSVEEERRSRAGGQEHMAKPAKKTASGQLPVGLEVVPHLDHFYREEIWVEKFC